MSTVTGSAMQSSHSYVHYAYTTPTSMKHEAMLFNTLTNNLH